MNSARNSLSIAACGAAGAAALVVFTALPLRAQMPPPNGGPASASPEATRAPAPPRPTPCQVPTPSAVKIYWPRRIAIPSRAAADFKRFNSSGFGSLIVVTRYDGSVTPLIPAEPEIDTQMRAVLAGFARELGSRPTVACGNATGVFVVRFYVPSGRIYHFEIPPPKD